MVRLLEVLRACAESWSPNWN